MEYIVKDLKFKQTYENEYIASIKIHDLIDINVMISTYNHSVDKTRPYWYASFNSNNNYNGFDVSNIPGLTKCTKFGFKTSEAAIAWANDHYKTKMNNITSCILADLYDYIEEIGEI